MKLPSRLFLLLISLIGLVSPVVAQDLRNFQERTLTINGVERNFILYVPPSYDGTTAVPLLFILHGGGGNPRRFVVLTRMSEIAREEGFIVAYPAGTGRPARPELMTWNAGYCCDYALAQNVDDVGFFRALVNSLTSEFNIDSTRIFAAGHSNGGMMTYRLAAEMSDVFAAVGVSAGTVGGYATENSPLYTIPQPENPVSVLHIHGTADENVMYNGGANGLPTANGRIDLAVSDTLAFWVKANQCDEPPTSVTSADGKVITATYSCATTGTTVELISVSGADHAWYGEQADTAADQLISATDEFWAFFKAHPRSS